MRSATCRRICGRKKGRRELWLKPTDSAEIRLGKKKTGDGKGCPETGLLPTPGLIAGLYSGHLFLFRHSYGVVGRVVEDSNPSPRSALR